MDLTSAAARKLAGKSSRRQFFKFLGVGSLGAGLFLTGTKVSLGAIHDFASTGPVKWGIGALASAYRIPLALRSSYGAHPTSFMIFVQGRL